MELRLEQGDYVPNGAGGFQRLEGAEALLQRVLFRLTARRGQFPFLPELGSRLYQLGREKPSAREALALQYVTEALVQEPDLAVMGAELTETAPRTGRPAGGPELAGHAAVCGGGGADVRRRADENGG